MAKLESWFSPFTHRLGGPKAEFGRGRHALKTYVCVRKSSSKAMGRLVRAQNVRPRIYIMGVTGYY